MAEQYILKVKIDDSDIRKLEKRLAALLTGKSIGGMSGGGSSGAGGSNANMGKNLAKLGIIATGVVGLLALTKKVASVLISSSPMLQQVLKLLNFSIMLIFRPIGDFIGFLLRPIMIMFLRKFIIPWYQTGLPVLQKVGTFIGDFVSKLMGEDGIVGIAASLGVIGVAVAGGIAVTVASAKLAGAVLANFISIGGNMAGKSFHKQAIGTTGGQTGLKATSTWKQFSAQITNLKSALKFPKPTWVTKFQSVLQNFINVLKPAKPAFQATGKGGFGSTATVTQNKPGFVKTGAMGSGNQKFGQPSWMKESLAKYGSSAGAKGGSSGKNISGSIKMGGGNLIKNLLGGQRVGSGGTAFMVAGMLDMVPEFKEAKMNFNKFLRDTTGANDPSNKWKGIDDFGVGIGTPDYSKENPFAHNVQGAGEVSEFKKTGAGGANNTTVNVTIGSIPDKSTADYWLEQIQSGVYK